MLPMVKRSAKGIPSAKLAFSNDEDTNTLDIGCHKIDIIAFRTFLVTFIAFCVIYWIVCA
jgi:hypothetical protein